MIQPVWSLIDFTSTSLMKGDADGINADMVEKKDGGKKWKTLSEDSEHL